MLDKFWESLGSDLADRWLTYLFGPAFIFWAGGAALYVWHTGWETTLDAVQALNPVQQGAVLVAALLLVVFSSLAMQALRFPVLRLLEGYWPWPFHLLGRGISALRRKRFRKQYERLRMLKSQSERSPAEKDELARLEVWAHLHPASERDLLPTALGNILRARERAPGRKYGLNAMVCWPRLWPLLPDSLRADLSVARESLDRLVELWFWGVLFLVWAPYTKWVILISLAWVALTYNMALQAAMAYGDLLEAAFDLHRMALYDALGWPRPKDSAEEKALGRRLTEFLWRGTLPGTVKSPQADP